MKRKYMDTGCWIQHENERTTESTESTLILTTATMQPYITCAKHLACVCVSTVAATAAVATTALMLMLLDLFWLI